MTTEEEYNLAIGALESMGENIHYIATDDEQTAILSVLEEHGQKALETVILKEEKKKDI